MEDKKKIRIIILFLYSNSILNILGHIINPTLASFLYYLLFSIVLASLIFVNGMNVSIKYLIIYVLYLLIILVNALIVNYPYYVLVDGLSGLVISALPAYVISTGVCFRDLLGEWYEYSKLFTKFSLVCVLAYVAGFVDYSIFASITIPNIMILSWTYSEKIEVFNSDFVYIGVNILVTLLLGGRMAFISEAMLVLIMFWIKKSRSIGKIFAKITFLIGMVLVIPRISIIVSYMYKWLIKRGVFSRTLYLLTKHLSSRDLFKNIYFANRDYIYRVSLEYIKEKQGLPGGFGVVRSLTQGRFYMPHNLILELLITFGTYAMVVILGIVIIRVYQVYVRHSRKFFVFLCFLLLYYLFISLTGQSVFTNPMAILWISLFFLLPDNKEGNLRHFE